MKPNEDTPDMFFRSSPQVGDCYMSNEANDQPVQPVMKHPTIKKKRKKKRVKCVHTLNSKDIPVDEAVVCTLSFRNDAEYSRVFLTHRIKCYVHNVLLKEQSGIDSQCFSQLLLYLQPILGILATKV